MRLFARATAPARAFRAVGAPTSFRVIAIQPAGLPTPCAPSTSSSLNSPSSRAFSTSVPVFKKGGKDKGGKKGKKQEVVEEEDADDEPRGKDKGSKDKGGKKGKKGKVEAEEEPKLSAADIAQIAEKTKAKMDKSVDWARGIVYDGVQRGRGHVSPGESRCTGVGAGEAWRKGR